MGRSPNPLHIGRLLELAIVVWPSGQQGTNSWVVKKLFFFRLGGEEAVGCQQELELDEMTELQLKGDAACRAIEV